MKIKNSIKEFEKALVEASTAMISLKLYVAGSNRKSLRAIENLKKFCDEHLKGRHELEVIDVKKNPHLIRENDLIALPTLLKPMSTLHIIGDLSDEDKICVALDIKRQTKL